MLSSIREKRRGARRAASGPVTLWWTDLAPRRVEGRLVDSSEDGFRIVHTAIDLGPGQQVQYRHAGGEGIARIVWSRISGATVETGLFVTQRS